jgi:hypothetical protein
MNRHVLLLAILTLVLALNPMPIVQELAGQEDPADVEPAAAGPVHDGTPVSIHVAIVEYLGADGRNAEGVDSLEKTDAWIQSLDDQKALLSLTRIAVATVDGERATTQFGERAAIETGRTRVPVQRGRGGFGGNPEDPREALAAAVAARNAAVSYQYEELGTIVRATPHVADDDGLVVELQLERSAVSPLRLPADLELEAVGQVPPPTIVRLQAESVVRLRDGETSVAYRKSVTSPHGLVETVILITASIGNARGDGPQPKPPQILSHP